MARLIKIDELQEGDVFLKWMYNRIFEGNKNVLGVELGPTGSGKSYRDLRKVELWYDRYMHKPFPKENICFGVVQIMERLQYYHKSLESGQKIKGEVLIFEEAGANLGSLDFQTRVSKMFSYVLQSFRSMNIAIFFNLPFLSMLNKQARMLLHYSSESKGVDMNNKTNSCKLFFHQVNQRTGVIYTKCPRVKFKGKTRRIGKLTWSMPSTEIVDYYEKQKTKYLTDNNLNYLAEMRKLRGDECIKMGRKDLTDKQKQVFDLLNSGLNQIEISKKLGKSQASIWECVQLIRKKGYEVSKDKKRLG